MRTYLIAILAMPTLLFCWVIVQFLAREFSRRHPESGPVREDGEGCSTGCESSGTQACPMVTRKNP